MQSKINSLPYAIFAAKFSLHSWRVANTYGWGSPGHQGTDEPQTHLPAFPGWLLSLDISSPMRLHPGPDILGPCGQCRRHLPGISAMNNIISNSLKKILVINYKKINKSNTKDLSVQTEINFKIDTGLIA